MNIWKYIKQNEEKELNVKNFLPWFKGIIFKILKLLATLNIGVKFRGEYIVMCLWN